MKPLIIYAPEDPPSGFWRSVFSDFIHWGKGFTLWRGLSRILKVLSYSNPVEKATNKSPAVLPHFHKHLDSRQQHHAVSHHLNLSPLAFVRLSLFPANLPKTSPKYSSSQTIRASPSPVNPATFSNAFWCSEGASEAARQPDQRSEAHSRRDVWTGVESSASAALPFFLPSRFVLHGFFFSSKEICPRPREQQQSSFPKARRPGSQ